MMQEPSISSSLDDWLDYLEQLHPVKIDMSLERLRVMADRLNIDFDATKIIVGGTNGKGSTCAMLESIYLAAGYQVGLFTSPHLIKYNERIRLNGEFATDEQIIEQFEIIRQTRADISLSYFEYTTLAAILLFKQHKLEVAIFEVGLGGRLDAVNILDADCSIITSIDIDHVHFLGDTRDKIAWEKAHIFRPNKPAICSDPVPPKTLIDYADQIKADLWLIGRDYNYSADKQQWAFAGRYQRRYALAYPALRGANQLLNASSALAAIDALREQRPVPVQAIRQGLLLASVPGRFQILPGQPTRILDVAHNPHAAAVLAHNLEHMAYHPYTYAVIGMLKDKDYAKVIEKLSKVVDYWYCADLTGDRALSGQALADTIQASIAKDKNDFPQVKVFDSPITAYNQAINDASDNDRVVVFGSFLTVSVVLEQINNE